MSAFSGLKRFVFWDYARATLQYDIMVAAILAFIFLTPRDWFRDQPKASSVVMLPAGDGANAYWIEPDLLSDFPETQRTEQAASLLASRMHKHLNVLRLEPIFGSEEEIKGFIAYTQP